MDNMNKTDMEPVFKIISYFIPAVFILVGLPLALKMIAPNKWYGIRTPRTLGDETTWYAVNTFGGWAFVISGIISMAFILWMFNSSEGSLVTKLLLAVLAPILFIAIGLILVLKAS